MMKVVASPLLARLRRNRLSTSRSSNESTKVDGLRDNKAADVRATIAAVLCQTNVEVAIGKMDELGQHDTIDVDNLLV